MNGPMTPVRRLLHYFARYRPSMIAGALCVVGSAVFSLLKPLIIGNAVNALTHALAGGTLVRYGLLLVGASIVEGGFLYMQRWIIIGTSRRIEFDMRNDFYGHLQKLPVEFYQEQRTGDLMSRATNDLSSVRMLIGPAVMHSFSSILVVSGAFIMMLRIDVGMALASLVAVPIVAGAVQFFGARIHVRFRAVQDYFGDISARVQENLSGVRVVRAFTQEQNEMDTFRRMNREYVDRNRALIRLTATFYPALHAFIGLMFVLVFFLGTRKIVAGTMTLGSFVAFQFLSRTPRVAPDRTRVGDQPVPARHGFDEAVERHLVGRTEAGRRAQRRLRDRTRRPRDPRPDVRLSGRGDARRNETRCFDAPGAA
jgi:ATP-binding cassette, subfamily B, multidrug efflux pump